MSVSHCLIQPSSAFHDLSASDSACSPRKAQPELQSWVSEPGFKDGNERPELAFNGTFFDSSYFPEIGYDPDLEINDPRRRREMKLGPLQELPPRGDPIGSKLNLFSPQSDWISFRTVVSTSDDQIALAPGYLQREWHANGRHYFSYDMGSVNMADFFAYVSARYKVKREMYAGSAGPIAIEVYYDAKHPYQVDNMIAASKAGLAYYEKQYSPFQISAVPNLRVSTV